MPAPRKTASLKAITGTARADRNPRIDYAERLLEPPEPPPGLSPRAVAEWRRLAPASVGIGTMTTADLRMFELLCVTLATATEAAEALAEEGLTVATADGGLKTHPSVKTMETARAQAARLLADFGLSPRARQSVDTAPPPRSANPWTKVRPSSDPFEEFGNGS